MAGSESLLSKSLDRIPGWKYHTILLKYGNKLMLVLAISGIGSTHIENIAHLDRFEKIEV